MTRSLKVAVLLVSLVTLTYSGFSQINKQHFLYQGRERLFDSRYIDAIASFNTIIKADTSFAEAYFFRGICKYNLGDFVGARVDFTKTISVNPLYTQAYHFRAITQTRIGEYEKALADFDKTLDLRVDIPGVYFNRGITNFLRQDFEHALKDFGIALAMDPKFTDAYINRGTARIYLRDTAGALSDYNKALQFNNLNPEPYLKRGMLYQKMEKQDSALADLNKTINLDSTVTLAYFSRGLVKNSKGDIKGALADFNRILTVEPGNALTLYNRALLKASIGDMNSALADYNKVAELNPKNVLIFYNRGGVNYELKKYKEAIRDYSKAIELYPDFANAYLNRSVAKRQINDEKGAYIDYQIAQKKISEYKSKVGEKNFSEFADTSKKFNKLLAFDADFGRGTEGESLIQNKKVEITLKPLFRLLAVESYEPPIAGNYYSTQFETFRKNLENVPAAVLSERSMLTADELKSKLDKVDSLLLNQTTRKLLFEKAILLGDLKRYTNALEIYNNLYDQDKKDAFALFNRSSVQGEMIEFINSIDNSFQAVALSESGKPSAKRQQKVVVYNYQEAIEDLNIAAGIIPDFPYIYYNRGNLNCLSSEFTKAISDYTKAIDIYPNMGEAYFNRGLVQLYLQDTEKGCFDVSKSGELGVKEAYNVIKRYCTKEEK